MHMMLVILYLPLFPWRAYFSEINEEFFVWIGMCFECHSLELLLSRRCLVLIVYASIVSEWRIRLLLNISSLICLHLFNNFLLLFKIKIYWLPFQSWILWSDALRKLLKANFTIGIQVHSSNDCVDIWFFYVFFELLHEILDVVEVEIAICLEIYDCESCHCVEIDLSLQRLLFDFYLHMIVDLSDNKMLL